MPAADSFKTFFKELLQANKGANPAILNGSEKPLPDAKAQLAVGGFEAAAYTRDRSYVYYVGADEAVNPTPYARREITRLSRYLVNNFSLMERMLTVVESYSIGPGLKAQASTADVNFNEENSALFDNWATTQFASANNQLNLYEAMKLMARELVIAGEFFVVLVKSKAGYPQFTLVKSEDVRSSGTPEDDSIDGLYVNDLGQVTAYNIFSGGNCQKIDASNVIHVFKHKAIGQLRGIGMFAASLNTVRDVKDLEVMLKRGVKSQAALAIHMKRKASESGSGLFGNVVPASGPTLIPTNSATNAGLEKVFGGAVVSTGADEDIDLLKSDHPTENVMEFIEQLIRNICLNLSLSYEFLVNVKGLNGTGVRFVINDAANLFATIQDLIINGVLNRLYQYSTACFIKLGKISIGGDALPYDVQWQRPLSITIDPTKVSNTEISLVQNSMQTLASFYESRGKDWKHQVRQRALEEQYINQISEEYGVSIARLRTLAAGSPVLEKEATIEQQQEGEDEEHSKPSAIAA